MFARLRERWPGLNEHIRGPGRTFPVSLHGDDGTGWAEDPTLVLTWSVGWLMKGDGLSTWLMRFPFLVLPRSWCLPETFPFVMAAFVNEQSP